MFSQDYKLNVLVCDGCACRCSLGAVEKDKGSGVFYPVINGRMISIWTDADGKLQNWGYYVHQNRSSAAALARARQIAKVCDYYETGLMPRQGAVMCMLCGATLPMKERCRLHWMAPVFSGGDFSAFVSGEHYYEKDGRRASTTSKQEIKSKTPAEALNGLRMYIAKTCGRALSAKEYGA